MRKVLSILIFLYSFSIFGDGLNIAIEGRYGYMEAHNKEEEEYNFLGLSLKAGYNYDDTYIFYFSFPFLTSFFPDTSFQIAIPRLGIEYILDLFRLIPFFDFNIASGVLLKDGEVEEVTGGIGFGFGLKYLLSKILTVGIDFRMNYWFLNNELPLLLELGFILSWEKEF